MSGENENTDSPNEPKVESTEFAKKARNRRTVHFDVEENKEERIPKSKVKVTKNNFSEGLLNVSLLTANASQLRYVLASEEHRFRELLLVLLSTSLLLQLICMILMIWTIMAKDRKATGRKACSWMAKETVKVLVLITITTLTAVNIFISAFSIPVSKRTGNLMPNTTF